MLKLRCQKSNSQAERLAQSNSERFIFELNPWVRLAQVSAAALQIRWASQILIPISLFIVLGSFRIDAKDTRNKRDTEKEWMELGFEEIALSNSTMDDFYVRLEELDLWRQAYGALSCEEQEALAYRPKPVRIVVTGSSLIASDYVTNRIRDGLVEGFGSAGPGFLNVDRSHPKAPKRRAATRAYGWKAYRMNSGHYRASSFGPNGVTHHSLSRKRKAYAEFKIRDLEDLQDGSGKNCEGEYSAHIFTTTPKWGGGLSLSLDRQWIDNIGTAPGFHSASFHLDGASAFAIRAKTQRQRVHGVSIQSRRPGVILDTFGIVAADATNLGRVKREIRHNVLSILKPDLLMFILGGNEIIRAQRSRKVVRRDLKKRLHDYRTEAPLASCLVVGPIEHVVGGKSRRRFKTKRYTQEVNAIFKEESHNAGCAYIDVFEAMGGSGAIRSLAKRRMMNGDLIHPRRKGLDLIGDAILRGLKRSYLAHVENDRDKRLASVR